VRGHVNIELLQDVYNRLQANEPPQEIVTELEGRLRASGSNAFVSASDSTFSHSPAEVHAWLLRMHEMLSQRTPVVAMYVEMNGFDLNYDKWFCSAFGYSRAIDVTGSDDRAYFDSEVHYSNDLTLSGMEAMQDAYKWWDVAGHPDDASESETIANLLVQVRFMALIRAGVLHGPLPNNVPVAAAAHESDLVITITPQPL
jgi:hypothetical protein